MEAAPASYFQNQYKEKMKNNVMKIYRFRVYPSKTQERLLGTHLWLAKNLWNNLLEHCKETYKSFDKFPTRNTIAAMTKESGMYSQVAQGLGSSIEKGIWRFVKLRTIGDKKAGFQRFKSTNNMNSLFYPQSGFSLGKKLKVTPFGEINIVQHREIKGKIKTLTLKRTPSGKWFACFTVEEIPTIKPSNGKPRVGMDLGLKHLAAFSNGMIIQNPRHIRKHQKKITFLQRKKDSKKKGSRNREKARRLVAIEFEKLKNTRRDFLHRLSHLANSYSFIALEALTTQELITQGFGKQINDASWGELTNMLRYKAESAGCEVLFVNPEDTTRMCCQCGSKKDMPLTVRTYDCLICGNHMDRDLNAAHNILKRATEGHSGSKDCEDVCMETSMKQEAHAIYMREHVTSPQ